MLERTDAGYLIDPSLRTAPNVFVGVRRGVRRKCPACGLGRLFSGYLALFAECDVCGNDNEQYPSDDFAPYLTILLVTHLLVPVLFALDLSWNLSVWYETALAIPVFAAATLAVLPFAKGGVVGLAWAVGVTRTPTLGA